MTTPIWNVLTLNTITWGYFSKNYDPQKNHLGVDFRIGKGEKVTCHFDGEVIAIGGSGTETYAIIWDGRWSHVFGHLLFEVKKGKVKKGIVLGTVLDYPQGAHLHYGLNSKNPIPLDATWGWGKCPVTNTKRDAADKGWTNPVINILSRRIGNGDNTMPTILHR